MGPKKDAEKKKNELLQISSEETIDSDQPAYVKVILDRLANIESKLDISNKLVKELEVKVDVTEKKLSVVENKLSLVVDELETVKANYKALIDKISFLEEEGLAAKIAINTIQQRGRICTVRVMNMKDEIKSSREAASYIYDSLFKTSLTDPQGNHPGAIRAIEYAHVLPSPPGKKKFPGHNYIVRFHGRYFKQPIIDDKKAIVDKFKDETGLSVKISQDFTWVNRQALSFLHKQDDVAKVTVRGDRLMIKLAADGDNAAWKDIINPFARKVAEMVA